MIFFRFKSRLNPLLIGIIFIFFPLLFQLATSSLPNRSVRPAPLNISDEAIFGIDISHYDTINWSRLAQNATIRFIIAKATEGSTNVDGNFAENWKQITTRGSWIPGAYHFYRLESSAVDNFANVKQNLLDRVNFTSEHLFMVDFETNDARVKPEVAARELYKFLQISKQTLGFKPYIYTGARFWTETIGEYHSRYPFGSYPLWIAHYTRNPSPNIPTDTWRDYSIWQFTNESRVDGIAGGVDLNLWKNPGYLIIPKN